MTVILEEGDLSAIEDSTRRSYGNQIERPAVYRIGRLLPSGVKELKPRGAAGGVFWVRPYTNDTLGGEAVEALNTDYTDDQLGFGVFVECVQQGNVLRIERLARENADYINNVPVPTQRTVDISQITAGLIRPTNPAGMSVTVGQAVYTLLSDSYLVPTIQSKDFTADRPATAGLAIAVLIEVDPATGTLVYTNSATFDADTPIQSAGAFLTLAVDNERFRAGWVKVYNGQTVIRRTDIYAAQEYLSKGGGGGDTSLRLWTPYTGFLINPNTLAYLEAET